MATQRTERKEDKKHLQRAVNCKPRSLDSGVTQVLYRSSPDLSFYQLSRRLKMSAKESKVLLSELASDPEIGPGAISMEGLVGAHDSLIVLGRMISADREAS